MTPQEQAEAMALTIRNSGSPSRVLIETLSKLIAENERLKDESRTWQERCDEMASIAGKENQKLTATEAKLEEAKEVIETMLASALPRQSEHSGMFYAWQEARAFLSTLTAEKKEEAK